MVNEKEGHGGHLQIVKDLNLPFSANVVFAVETCELTTLNESVVIILSKGDAYVATNDESCEFTLKNGGPAIATSFISHH